MHMLTKYTLCLTVAIVPFRAVCQTSPWLHFSLAPGAPSLVDLNSASVVYDPGTNSLIAFGGNGSPNWTPLNGTWILASANATSAAPWQWQQLSTGLTLPPGRSGHSAVYDQVHNRMIIFGGGVFNGDIYSTLYNDVWVLTHANGTGGLPTWIPIVPSTPNDAPQPRAHHRAVYDPNSNQMTIFGGGNNGTEDIPNDVWALSNANGIGGQPQWIPISPAGTSPARRENEIATYSVGNNAMTVFGGCCPSTNDVWTLSNADGVGTGSAWQQLAPAGPAPSPRASNGAYGYDPDTNMLVVFGGLGYTPEGTFTNDTWILTDVNNRHGMPTWINTIANGSASSPPASVPNGAYDSVSKRLMVLEDPADLWIMTTRNGIDLSCSAGVPTASRLNQLWQAGIQYAVVEAAQYDSGECPAGQIATAQQQFDAFAGAGFKTAAYCFLYFNATSGTGVQQAENCLNTIQSSRLGTISFIALEVEGSSSMSHSAALKLISDAANAVVAAGQKPVVYTGSGWRRITGNPTPNPLASFPLWITGGTFSDAWGRRHCGDGVPSLTPSTATFGGWSVLSGKQYDLGVGCGGAALAGMTVDFDVFDPSLFQ